MAIHLQREIDQLKTLLLALCAMVEETVADGVRAVIERDAALAEKVIDGDYIIDKKEVEVEEECLKILALHQPVAIDLRFIIASLKINNDLERIGDLASNIAARAIGLCKGHPPPIPFDLSAMAERTKRMLRMSLDSLVKFDTELAQQVRTLDDEIDAYNRDNYVKVTEAIRKEPQHADLLILMLSVSRNLERISDYTTNIAEDVIYMIDGEIVRHLPYHEW